MKHKIYQPGYRLIQLCLAGLLALSITTATAQDSSAAVDQVVAPKKVKPAKNTFQSIWIIDNQTVMVPIKGTLELDFQHRMGNVNNGSEDLWGLYGASANIRLGVNYAPVNRLNLGIGITKNKMLLDLNAKYAIITQTPGKYPVSATYYGNAAVDTRKEASLYDGAEMKHNSDRYSFYNELIIARKFNDHLSLQAAASWSHQNAVTGFYTSYDTSSKSYGDVYQSMEHEHFAVSLSGRYKFSNICSIIFSYSQPITSHSEYNPNPCLSLGLEVNTSSHTFQVFVTNFDKLNAQQNNLYNHNNPFKEYTTVNGDVVKGYQYLIGFNITRLWNY